MPATSSATRAASRAIRSSSSARFRRISSSSAAEQVPVVGHPLAADPGRLVGDLVAVVGPDRLGGGRHGWPRPPARAAVALLGGPAAASAAGHLGPRPGLVDHRGGDHAAAGPHPPSGGREPVAVPGDHHQVGAGQGQVDGLGPAAAARSTTRASSVSSTASSPGRSGPPDRGRTWPRIDSVPGGRRPGPASSTPPGRGRLGEGEDGTGGPALAQPGQRGPGRLAARDDHGGQRGAGGGLEGLLPARVHLDQVEQRPDHAVDPGQQLGPGRPPGLVEGPLEGVGPGLRTGACSCSAWRSASSAASSAAGGPPWAASVSATRRLQLVAALLGLGQALAELVVLALEHARPGARRRPGGRRAGRATAGPARARARASRAAPGPR